MTIPHAATSATQSIQSPFVIGTAGHVDHGKSTLVRALTGIDPDRLNEEREREMTIDLGFAWLTLPSGRDVSVIDVPGHERFVRNMLAGVGGIDLAMLVIAADDGPMPQTREHLAILDLLGIEHGVVVLSRVDLVDDEWRELVTEEVSELLEGTSLAGSSIVPVSATTGEGLDTLRTTLDTALDATGHRDASGRPRLPIDRSFKVSGFGTVVTGTLVGGEVEVGQELMLYPDGRDVRVRGIQAHQQQVERVQAGSRVALNLSGIDHREVRRGQVLASAGSLVPSLRLDCRIELVPDAPMMLEQNDEVIVFAGAAEVPARVTLLDRESIGPGERGWVQLRLAQELAVLRGDRVILRRPSPASTIGGGVVVDPNPARHKRFQQDVIANLEVMAEGTPEDLIAQALGDRATSVGELAKEVGIGDPTEVLTGMLASGDLVSPGLQQGAALGSKSTVLQNFVFERLMASAASLLDDHHARYPLQPGIRRDEFRTRLGVGSQRAFDDIVRELEHQEVIRTDGAVVASPDFAIQLSSEQRALADTFIAAARMEPFAPPAPQEHDVSAEVIEALSALGEVVAVTDQIVYPTDVFATIRDRVLEKLDQDTTITLAEYRDMFGTSRKFAQPTLEYLDEQRITRRKGDVRVRYRGPGAG